MDNVIKHYLQNRVGVNTTERNNIMSAIFGDDGLVSADDTFNFKAKSLQVIIFFLIYVLFNDTHLQLFQQP
jgi:hypothetical protein